MNTVVDESGQPLQKSEEKMARCKRHFEKVLNVQSVVAENVIEELEDRSEVETTQVTREEGEQAVRKLQNCKAAGEDGIVSELLKYVGEAMILQEVWKMKQVLNEWKKAVLVLLHKQKDRKICDNYHSISLLSVLGKELFCC